jgi:hypothetical protein
VVALVVLGVALRARQYLAGRSLWVDEAMLASNVVWTSLGDLVSRPLFLHQGAPAGFLAVSKVMTLVLGPADAVLRLAPFLYGCLAIVVFAGIARRLFTTPVARVFAIALMAVSPSLVYYSAEFKQYASDVFWTVLCLWAFMAWRDWRAGRVWLAAAGAGAVWCSHPAVFVLAAGGLVEIACAWRSRAWRHAGAMVAMAGGWLVLFAMHYLLCMRFLTADPLLREYWREGYVPLSLSVGPTVAWVAESLRLFAHLAFLQRGPAGLADAAGPIGAWPTVFAGGLVAGAVALAAVHRRAAATLAGVLAVVLGLSALRLYPCRGRLILFLVPMAFLAVGAAAEWLGTRRQPVFRAAAWATAAMVLALPLVLSLRDAWRPLRFSELRPVLAHLAANRHPEDDILVGLWGLPAYNYYASRYGLPVRTDEATTVPLDHDAAQFLSRMQSRPEGGRVWLVFSHRYGDAQTFVRQVSRSVPLVASFEAAGAGCFCFDFGAGRPSAAVP